MTTTTTTTTYCVVDAQGHHGDTIKVYRVSRSLAAARKFVAGSPLFSIVRNDGGWKKGTRISRATWLAYYR